MVGLNKHFQHNGPKARSGGGVTAAITLPNTDQSRTYNLDGLGNWRATGFMPVGGSQTTDQRNHNYVNEITQRTLAGRSPVVFQYDGATGGSNGNLKNDGTLIYAYDALNSPIQINRVSDGLVIATYVYDAMNRRVRKTILNGGLTGNVPNSTTDYIWSGSQVVEERNAGNTPIRQYVWGTYIDELIQPTTLVPIGPQNLSPGPYYLLQDLLYRAVALTNSSGAIVEAYDCDAYGNTLIFTGPGPDGIWFTDDDVQSSYGANEIIYCGYRFDPETGLYYVRNRTYSPALGRWLQRDPVGHTGGINLYEYVKAASTIALDPAGLWRILRKGHAWANAEPDMDKDPVSGLAKLARMDPTEARKWMNPYELSNSVKKGCPVKVPNTVYITRGDISIAVLPGIPNPALILNSVIIINRIRATLQSQGFHTVVDWQVTSMGLQAYVDAPWTYGLVFVGHGDLGVGWLFAADKEVAILLPYHRLGLVVLMACYAAKDASWLRLVSPTGILRAPRGEFILSPWKNIDSVPIVPH